MKKLFGIFLGLLIHLSIWGQDPNDAVVYLQGDKETPIYVKMEGMMMERYSKHYFILNRLASGPLHLEILFQQNKYPAQKFVLNIAPSVQRALVLQRVGENQFALYDLDYGIYIPAENKLDDDISTDQQLAAMQARRGSGTTAQPPQPVSGYKEAPNERSVAVKAKESKAEKPQKVAAEKKPKSEPEKLIKEAQSKTETEKVVRTDRNRNASDSKKEDERFLDFEIEKKEKESQTASRRSTSNSKATKANCSEPATEMQLKQLLSMLDLATDEEKKLVTLRKNATKYCLSTEQIRVLALKFMSQSSRYEVARALKVSVTDPELYPQLADLFNTNYLKDRFLKEIAK